jgi:hypothetical protein
VRDRLRELRVSYFRRRTLRRIAIVAWPAAIAIYTALVINHSHTIEPLTRSEVIAMVIGAVLWTIGSFAASFAIFGGSRE